MTLTEQARTEMDYAEQAEALAFAQAALRVLPDTPEGIAEYLTELGVQGHVGDFQSCALEAYLEGATGYDCDVRRESVEFGNGLWAFTLKLSSVVSRFGWAYDGGEYEALYGTPTPGRTERITAAELSGLQSVEG